MTTQPEDLDQRLASVPIFSGLSRRQRQRLLDQAKVVDHQAGREVASEGKGAMALHLLLSGGASVSVRGEQVRTLGPGDYFGEISLIDGKPRSATVTTTEPTRTLAVPHLVFDQLLDDDASVAKAVLLVLCQRLREAEAN